MDENLQTNFYICIPRFFKIAISCFFITFGMLHSANATHALGAELTYSCTATPNQYLLTLKFFRDCDGIDPDASYDIDFSSLSGCANGGTVVATQLGSSMDITPLCPGETSTCNGGNIDGVEVYTYTATVNLPAQCNDWVVSFTECCRNDAISNLSNPGNEDIYIEAVIDNTVAICNNSPTFNNPASFLGCSGQPISYNHGVVDVDGDQLVFSFVDCMEGPNNVVEYSGGFSGTNPIATTAGGGISIDPNTGAISFTASGPQVAVLCVKVEEFRNGVKIGEVVRDIQFNIVDCSGSGITAPTVAGPFTYTTFVGQQICFNITPSDGNGDNMMLSTNNGIAGGTFSPSLPTGFSANPTTQFCWTPTAAEIGTTQFFTLTVTDDACPISSSNTYTYQIIVNAFQVVCPNNNNLGSYDCSTLGNIPACPTTVAQVQAAPYNVSINGNAGTIVLNCTDTSSPDVCTPSNQTIIRSITILDDLNGNNIQDGTEEQLTCNFTYTILEDLILPTFTFVPTSTTASCDNIPAVGTPTATDNCGTAAISFNETIQVGDCDVDGYIQIITRTWTATDACNNTNVATQFITVSDLGIPVLSSFPANITVECDAIPVAETLTATDNCDTNVPVVYSEMTNSGSCENSFLLIRNWSATDDCGNLAEHNQLIVVEDTQAPVLAGIPANTTASCDNVPSPPLVTATDNCFAPLVISLNQVSTPGFCIDNYTITRTWSVSDDCGNSDVQTQTIAVSDNTNPTILVCPDNRDYDACDTNNLGIDLPVSTTPANVPDFLALGGEASDNCTLAGVTYIDVVTGGCPNATTITRTYTASDACGNIDQCTQIITVNDNSLPVITTCPPTQNYEGCSLSDIGAPDLAFSATSATVPDFAALGGVASDACGIASITYIDTQAGTCPITIDRTYTVTDACGNATTCNQTITVNDTMDPSFTFVPANTAVECDAIPAVGTPTATDNCGTPSITFEQTTTAGICEDAYVINRTWTVTDACGNSDVATQFITVSDSQIPMFSALPANITVECDAIPAAEVLTVSDNCDPNPSFDFSEAINPGTCADSYFIVRTWESTDRCGNLSSHNQLITVEDTQAPMISCPPNRDYTGCGTGDIGIDLPFSTASAPVVDITVLGGSVSDNCTLGTVSYSDVQSGGCPAPITITRTYVATDDCGNMNSCQQIITVTDSADPTITCPPARTYQGCSVADIVATDLPFSASSAPVVDITALGGMVADDCGVASVTYIDTQAGACGTGIMVTRNYTVTDVCGNTATCTQEITIIDDSLPVITTCPPTQNYEGCSLSDIGAPDLAFSATSATVPDFATLGGVASDACGIASITYIDTQAGTCPITINRTYTVTDACGNATTCNQTITVNDTTDPSFTFVPANTAVECDAIPAVGTPTATDNCGTPSIIFEQTTTAGICEDAYVINRTWTVTDACGNSDVATQFITVSDSQIPMFSALPANITVECDAIPAAEVLTVSDNCDPNPSFDFSEAINPGTCADSYFIVRTWESTDRCGNLSSHNQLITVEDTQAPMISCPPNRDYTGCGTGDIGIDLPFSTASAPVVDITVLGGSVSDNCTLGTVSYSDVQSGGCPAPITITRTYVVTDDCGNMNSCQQIITVTDSANPTITCPPARTYQGCSVADIGATDLPFSASSAPVADITALGGMVGDDCGVASVTYIDTQAGACPSDIVVTRTYTVTDACGNTATCEQLISVEDTTAPMITTCPTNTNYEGCSVADIAGQDFVFSATSIAVPASGIGYITATDNCNLASLTYIDTQAGACPNPIVVTRTYTATDDCGNTDQCVQTITIDDTTNPVLAGIPANETVECDAIPAAAMPTASDNCDANPNIVLNETTIPGSCDFTFTISREWTATDACGNSDVQTQFINVQDTTIPVLSALPANITVECDAVPTAANITVTDNCDTNIAINFDEQTNPGACADTYIIVRTWSASDICGNFIQHMQLIEVEDTTDPMLTCPPNRTYEGCTAADIGSDLPVSLVETAVPDMTAIGGSVSDNCTLASITYIDTQTGGCPDPITITRTYTATDACSNSTVCTQTIIVEDTTPPITLCQDITVTPDAVTGMVAITPADIDNGSSDNCSAVTLSLDIVDFDCSNLGDNPVILTAVDACGNSSTCSANVFVDSDVEKPKTRNAFYCIGGNVSANEGMEAICPTCDAGGVSSVQWFDSEFGGNLVGTGEFFHPVDAGVVPADEEGCYTFYAQCLCDNFACPSFREKASFQVIECELSCEEGCTYFLVLEDEACNGWDGASIDVSLNEAWPATNYKLQPNDCNGFGNFQVIPLHINDGGTIDIAYWNGAFETEHAYTLLDSAKDTVYASGYDGDHCNTLSPFVGALDFKANCPTCCIDQFEDYTVRITIDGFPEEYSWEIYEGAADVNAQGPQVIGVTATTYAGLAPGSQVLHEFQLEKCKDYTFVAFDGFNDSWNGGTWELISANIDYGTEILDLNDPLYGNSLVLNGPNNAAFVDEERVGFTIPCQNCYDAPVVLDGADNNCVWDGDLPVNEPYVCYPNSNHALPNGCIMEELIVLVNGDPNAPMSVATGPFTYVNGEGSVAVTGLPVGHHGLVHQTTYCDGIISKCTTSLAIVRDLNPTLTCNDLVHVSLGVPEWEDDDNDTGNTYQDDLGECIIEITPDMVLEMPNFCDNEYKVTLLDENDQPIIVYDVNGLPLDEAGQSIPEGNQSSVPAHNLASAAQAGQTLKYVVEHIYSDNVCWGEILIEDKYDPTIVCTDYDLACTHPNALDEFYNHSEISIPPMELPANIAGGTAGVVSNTFIPINMPCGPLGEMIQNLEIAIDITHNDITDLQIILHAPSAAALPAILLADNGDVNPTNVFNPSNNTALLALIGMPCSVTASTSPEDFITENSGSNLPANAGGTWYIQVIDNNATFPTPPFGGGEITAASISLTCGFPFPYSAYDCTLEGVELLSEELVETDCNQSDWNGAQIKRVWRAIDAFGNSSTCMQTVNLKAPTMDQIVRPTDIQIECEGQSPASITPEISGTPQFDCFDLNQEEHHGFCDLSYTYEDQILPICGQGYKIIRTWTFINWCSGVTKYMEQLIKVEDTVGPTVNVDDIISNTGVYDCTANISFNEAVTDVCSGIESIEVSYTLGGGAYEAGNLIIVDVTNGGTLNNLPLGVTQLLIKAQDGCLNVTEELVSITIEDNTVPVATCNDNLNVSLGSDGQAWVYAEDVDEGSWDNCGIASIEVRRVGGCLGTSAWADAAPVDCCDVDGNVTIELRVTDNAGNTNICWQTVLVEDALAPTVTCPDNVTVDCNDPLLHDLAGLTVFGEPTYEDNCTAIATLVETDNRDQCKAGTITRRWTVSDGSDKSLNATCTQTITVDHISDFIVQFPSDVTVSTCPNDLGLSGEPTLSNDDCELVAVNYDDLVLTIVDDACYKIERTWTLINWCVYDQENADNTDLGIPQPLPRTYQDDDGYFTYVQTIKVLDSEAPTITCPLDQTFCDLTDGCEGEAQLTIEVEDACSPADVLEYTYKIDAFNDGSFDIIDEGNDATGIYPYGTHLIKWIVEDGCGNTSSCSYLFTIEDCKNPTPVCLNGISIENMQTGCVEVWAADLLEYAFDNCSSDDYVESSVKIKRTNVAGAPGNSVTLCCDDLGTVFVEIWVEDEAGNTDYCTTYIIVQDNLNNCPQESSKATIAGNVETEQGNMVEDVMMDLDGTTPVALPTSVDGTYQFPYMDMYDSYTVVPEKGDDPLNGVSTFDLVLMSQHILGINTFNSPYQMIAADVNADGNISTFDVVQNRQLILYIIQDFPSNTSWRFVDKDYIFPNPQNPWVEAFPETIHFDSLDEDEMATDFVGIKIGDVNGDATVNTLLGAEERNMEGTLNFRIQEQSIETGMTIEIPVRSTNFTKIQGFQYTLQFDKTALEYKSVRSGAIEMSEANIGTSFEAEGLLTSSYSSAAAKTIPSEEVLFTLIFEGKASNTLATQIGISSKYTKAEAYNSTALLDVVLEIGNQSGVVVANELFELFQNSPNPFNGETIIGFTLPQASSASLKIFDVSGQLLKVIEGDFATGYNQVKLQSKDLAAKGLLYYELTTENNSDTKKMLLIE